MIEFISIFCYCCFNVLFIFFFNLIIGFIVFVLFFVFCLSVFNVVFVNLKYDLYVVFKFVIFVLFFVFNSVNMLFVNVVGVL